MHYAYTDTNGLLLAYGDHDLTLAEVQALFPAVTTKITDAADGLEPYHSDSEIVPIYESITYFTHTSGDGTQFGDWTETNDLRPFKFMRCLYVDQLAEEQLKNVGFTWGGDEFELTDRKKMNYTGALIAGDKGLLTYPVKVRSKYNAVHELADLTAVTNFWAAGLGAAFPVAQWATAKAELIMAAASEQAIMDIPLDDIP